MSDSLQNRASVDGASGVGAFGIVFGQFGKTRIIDDDGNGHVRRILIEAALHDRHRPMLSVALCKRQEGISKEVRDVSWVAQQPLGSRLTHSISSGKPRNKAIVALARELAGFIWSLGQVSQLLA